MKTYKNILRLCAVIICLASLNSCLSILEKPSSSDVTLDTIFSNRDYAESALYNIYYQLVPRGFPYTNGNYPENKSLQSQTQFSRSLLASITDECCNYRGATPGRYVNVAGFDAITASRNQEDSWAHRWPGIRAAWTFIKNIDKVPDEEIPDAEKTQMIAEAKALIALAYMDMLPRYAAMPIVDHPLGEGDATLLVQRSTLKETIDFILKLCEEAIPDLPDTYPSNMRGRVTKGVPLCIKSRTLLYAASPLFNSSASDMILDYDHPEFVCLEGYDKERWLKAAEAANDVLVWASTAGVSLITAADIAGGETDPKHNAYGYATSEKDNKEVILANKGYSSSNNGFGDGIFWTFSLRGMSVMLNIIKYFRKADASDQTWPTTLNEHRPFSEYTTKMNEMEPRFLQCVWPAGQAAPNFTKTGDYTKWPFGKIDDQMSASDMHGVGPMVKFCYNYSGELMKDWIVFRLAEFYLNYAEATAEYYGSADAKTPTGLYTAAQAVDVIRTRGGIRVLNAAEKADFHTQIVRERAVELFAEGHRWWDCKRWKIADDTFGGTLYTLRFVQNVAGSTATSYTEYYLAEHAEPRVWTKAMYFYPFPQEEVDKGYLVQNPGY
ncbi:MAG: RagB/SusD family nutrient uptake outer membrane protein [Bacteroidales bacterium]|nr:RagB/SusD family nutrient uptake outer membrane protein [Bacteroidales bacterium]